MTALFSLLSLRLYHHIRQGGRGDLDSKAHRRQCPLYFEPLSMRSQPGHIHITVIRGHFLGLHGMPLLICAKCRLLWLARSRCQWPPMEGTTSRGGHLGNSSVNYEYGE
ncbi:hypothetical protein IEO21_03644 [Rhodonia placenta]|uniref:Uncharacterized protein n=1 Tax=Rhodonia placenta TaxID=104341 RepID=A0A8H7P5S5_9APHY|nr:hypothetical protein IEO21_03644 [Postia placenta]